MDATTHHAGSLPPVERTVIAGFPALTGRPSPSDPDRPPVVFLHGAFADESGFEGWVARAAGAGFAAWAPCRRGRNGVGPERAAGVTFDDYLDDTRAVIDALGAAPILVGHSLGGLIAQRMAAEGRAAAIVLLAPAPPAMLTAQAIALPRFAPNLPRIMTGRPFIVPNGACSVLALNAVPDADRPAIHAHLTHESGKVYRAAMLGTIRVDARRVQVPVLVIGGDEDRIISTRLLRKTARHYGVEARILAGHAHWLLQEPGWESLAEDVLAWAGAATEAVAPNDHDDGPASVRGGRAAGAAAWTTTAR